MVYVVKPKTYENELKTEISPNDDTRDKEKLTFYLLNDIQ